MILSFWLSCFLDLHRAVESLKLCETCKETIMLMYVD